MVATKTLGLGIALVVGLLTFDVDRASALDCKATPAAPGCARGGNAGTKTGTGGPTTGGNVGTKTGTNTTTTGGNSGTKTGTGTAGGQNGIRNGGTTLHGVSSGTAGGQTGTGTKTGTTTTGGSTGIKTGTGTTTTGGNTGTKTGTGTQTGTGTTITGNPSKTTGGLIPLTGQKTNNAGTGGTTTGGNATTKTGTGLSADCSKTPTAPGCINKSNNPVGQTGTNTATTTQKSPEQQWLDCRKNRAGPQCATVVATHNQFEKCRKKSTAPGCGQVAGSFDQYWCKTNPGAAGCTPSNPTSTTVSTGGTTGNPTSTTVSTGGTTGNPTSTTGGTGGTPTTVATGGTPGSPGNPVVTGTGGGPGGPKGPTNCGGAGVNCVPSLTSGPGNPIPKPVNQPSKGPVIVLANLSFPIVVGPKRIWRDGGWRSFVPFDALDVVRVDNGYYYPSAYVSVGRSYCGGRTPEGCHLNWQTVSFAGGGGSAFQCVQFCPRPGRPPPPRFTALAPPPPVPPSGRCEVAIFADPGFGGASSPATADQPNLGEVGWKDQIGSLQVKAGVWDFFGDDQFQGESMRLQPGQYPQLSPEFTKHIGSFMCVQGT